MHFDAVDVLEEDFHDIDLVFRKMNRFALVLNARTDKTANHDSDKELGV